MTREQFIRAARKWARKEDAEFDLDTKLGKGSHYRLTVGGKITTLKSGRYKPGYVRLLCRQLGIPPDEL